MKTLFAILTFLFLSQVMVAQTPQRFNYQAVARDLEGGVMSESNLGIRVSIVDMATSSILYSESHTKTTNNLGLFKLEIGGGTIISGDMGSINWGSSSHSLKIDIDFAGGSDYISVGSTQILSVPYALHAESASNVDDADANPSNEIQTLSLDGTTLSISDGNSINLPASGGGSGDDDPNNEVQDLSSSKTGSNVTLEITKGGTGTSFSVSDADSSTTNEIQTISKSGTTVTLSSGGGSFEDADADSTNELQSLSLTGTTLSISDGNAVELPSGGADADADPTNEIQTLSKSGNMISLSKEGGSIADAVDDADADPNNEIQDLSLTAIADGGIDGMTIYQLNLTGSDPVDLPINQWWSANILLIDPPQVGNVFTPYPVVVDNILDAQSITSQSVQTLDLQVGEPDGAGSLHLQQTGLHFDGGPVSNDLGWFLEREEIRYGVTLPSSDFKSKLTKEDLTFSNDAGWTSTYLGGASSGELSLYPGGGSPQFFRAWLDETSPKFILNDFSIKLLEGRPSGQGGGEFATFGSDGNRNIWLTHLNNFPDNGWLGIIDGNGTIQASMSVNAAGLGVVAADMKNFIMDHPLDETKNIQYASLEGPEAAAYERGTGRLIEGEADIKFSEHFKLVIGANKMTVMITPLSANSKGIAVIEKRSDGFKVKELLKGAGTYEFDWEVKAIRDGFEGFKPIVNKSEHAPASNFGEKKK